MDADDDPTLRTASSLTISNIHNNDDGDNDEDDDNFDDDDDDDDFNFLHALSDFEESGTSSLCHIDTKYKIHTASPISAYMSAAEI